MGQVSDAGEERGVKVLPLTNIPPPPSSPMLRCVSSWGRRLLPSQHSAPLPGRKARLGPSAHAAGGRTAGPTVRANGISGVLNGGSNGHLPSEQQQQQQQPGVPLPLGGTLRRTVLSGAALDPLVAAQWAAFSHAWDALVRRGRGEKSCAMLTFKIHTPSTLFAPDRRPARRGPPE